MGEAKRKREAISLDAQEAAALALLGPERFEAFGRETRAILDDHRAACERLLGPGGSHAAKMERLDELDREQVRRFKAVWRKYGVPDPEPRPPGW